MTDGVASSRKLAFQGSDFGFMTGHDVLESRFINGGYALFFFAFGEYIHRYFFAKVYIYIYLRIYIYIYIVQFPYKMLLGRSWGGDHIRV